MAHIYDSTLQVMVNGIYYNSNSEKIQADTWYTISIIHRFGLTDFYLNDSLIQSKNIQLDHPENDIRISNTHFGWGQTFRGNWKDLKVFTASPSTNIAGEQLEHQIRLYPNPVNNQLYVSRNRNGSYYRLLDPLGRTTLKGVLSDEPINLKNIPGGVYHILIFDLRKQLISLEQIVKLSR